MIVTQIILWVAGIATALYLAGYQMLFSGAVDLIMAIVDMFRSGANKELAVTAVLSFMKVCFAGLVGWVILFATGMLSAIVSDYRK